VRTSRSGRRTSGATPGAVPGRRLRRRARLFERPDHALSELLRVPRRPRGSHLDAHPRGRAPRRAQLGRLRVALALPGALRGRATRQRGLVRRLRPQQQVPVDGALRGRRRLPGRRRSAGAFEGARDRRHVDPLPRHGRVRPAARQARLPVRGPAARREVRLRHRGGRQSDRRPPGLGCSRPSRRPSCLSSSTCAPAMRTDSSARSRASRASCRVPSSAAPSARPA
jgi:hypothetical protein